MRKPNLASALHGAAGKEKTQAAPPPAEPVAQPTRGAAAAVPPSRQGKRAITGFFDPAVAREVKQLALNHDSTVQALLTEALNDLFVKHGRNPIAS